MSSQATRQSGRVAIFAFLRHVLGTCRLRRHVGVSRSLCVKPRTGAANSTGENQHWPTRAKLLPGGFLAHHLAYDLFAGFYWFHLCPISVLIPVKIYPRCFFRNSSERSFASFAASAL